MGCDIHPVIEVKRGDKWEFRDDLCIFGDCRSYALFGWLAGVRNYSAIEPLSPPRGLPEDCSPLTADDLEYGHSHSWFLASELLAVDYDQLVEDRRCTVEIAPRYFDGGQTCEKGKGTIEPLREFLGDWAVREIESLREMGPPDCVRFVFAFDD